MPPVIPSEIAVYLDFLGTNFTKNKIKKRNGVLVNFDVMKIFEAVRKSFAGEDCIYTYANVTYQVCHDLLHVHKYKETTKFDVELIQDTVENILMRDYPNIARKFIIYREMKRQSREAKDVFDVAKIINSYIDESDWRTKENSNIGYSIGALILNNSGAMSSNYWLEKVYTKEIGDAHRSGAIHIHDLSYLTGYCMGLSLRKLVNEGIPGLNGNLASKPARHLHALVNQCVNFMGISQNEVAGAVAFSSVDTWFAPFVRYDNLDQEQVKQCMQSLIFGLNIPSRWGGQCVLPSTEVLTPQGWKNMSTLKDGDDIYCWDNGELKVGKNNKTVIKDYNGILISFENSHYKYKQVVTEEHRCITTGYNQKSNPQGEITLAKDVKKWHNLPISIEANLEDNPNISDIEIELAARLYCDGQFEFRHLEGRKSLHRVRYYKSSEREAIEPIRKLFEDFGVSGTVSTGGSFGGEGDNFYEWKFYSDDARKLLELVGDKQQIADKFLTLGSRQARLFLDTWMISDGQEEYRLLQYDSETIANALQHIALCAGFTSFKMTRKVPSSELNDYCGGEIHYVKLRGKKNLKYKERKETFYSGKVWCPSTTHGTAIFRDADSNVFISGQSIFSNFTFDLQPPADLKDQPAIIGGAPWEDYTYADFQVEMDMINKAFLELMYDGDADGRPFSYPIPTYNITKDLNWDSEIVTLLFKMAGKYGLPYFQNFINSDLDPSAVRSMCCRLQLSKTELLKRGGGLFGADEFTGSMGVVTINLPQIGYLIARETNYREMPPDDDDKTIESLKSEFWGRVKEKMDIARESLLLKKKTIERFTEIGLYPYTKHHIKHWNNHFLTIGLVGMNEALLNLIGQPITSDVGKEIAMFVLQNMRQQIIDYQMEDDKAGKNNLYNLEATPAEGCGTRMAQLDKKNYPDIITAGDENGVYYTNSTMPSVNAFDDVFDWLDHNDEFQCQYTGGTVAHLFLGESVDASMAKKIVYTTFEKYKLPYLSLTPTYSVCKEHGYISGEHPECPKCAKPTEVYSRVVGYYRPVRNWNKGKQQEFKERQTLTIK